MSLEQLINNYKDEIVQKTQELIKIRSVEEEGKPGMPFGEGPNEALEYALKLSEELGFKTENFDGYAGHADLGEGEETIGVLVHLDVVPEGEGWTYPPYAAEIHNDKIYGRGTIDDKGPAIAALYAMKAIKESGLSLNKKIRIIFGTNEESGWGGVKYYFDKVKAPNMAFTPDAEFPVIHGEKGISIFKLKKSFENQCNGDIKIKSIKGGNRPNMVPDSCTAVLEANGELHDDMKDALSDFVSKTGYKITLEQGDNEVVVRSEGVSAHGSLPQSGKNAVSQLLQFLGSAIECEGDMMDFIKVYNDKIGMEYNGQSIGCGLEDDVSGKLTFNVGVIDMDETQAEVVVNIRYPIKHELEKIYNGIRKELDGTNIELEEGTDMKPIYVPKDHPLVSKLMKVYREVTGDEETEPITIGGGTYARALDNAVAFGPLFPGQEELAHQKDEYIEIESLIKNALIYAKALYELAK
ncbi:dipeptidase PepV [Sporosalibacterium faouarense]|uniref:dipeptidase PepV n=1 Tax=Sporosalibacterium faouarense TaxID=516123 RepID=UPI00192CB54A|nr:dipeptidase PepV [Sporosalibacterium faouarense]